MNNLNIICLALFFKVVFQLQDCISQSAFVNHVNVAALNNELIESVTAIKPIFYIMYHSVWFYCIMAFFPLHGDTYGKIILGQKIHKKLAEKGMDLKTKTMWGLWTSAFQTVADMLSHVIWQTSFEVEGSFKSSLNYSMVGKQTFHKAFSSLLSASEETLQFTAKAKAQKSLDPCLFLGLSFKSRWIFHSNICIHILLQIFLHKEKWLIRISSTAKEPKLFIPKEWSMLQVKPNPFYSFRRLHLC